MFAEIDCGALFVRGHDGSQSVQFVSDSLPFLIGDQPATLRESSFYLTVNGLDAASQENDDDLSLVCSIN